MAWCARCGGRCAACFRCGSHGHSTGRHEVPVPVEVTAPGWVAEVTPVGKGWEAAVWRAGADPGAPEFLDVFATQAGARRAVDRYAGQHPPST